MDVFILLIAITALVLAVMAFQRVRGIQNLRQQIDKLNAKSEHDTKEAYEIEEDLHHAAREFIGSLRNRQSKKVESTAVLFTSEDIK